MAKVEKINGGYYIHWNSAQNKDGKEIQSMIEVKPRYVRKRRKNGRIKF